ncbi:hypothetical protein B9479_003677 [Cryptococcus floricola]|uniref:Autophagy-related protein 13 n=1 Tax=Cryptococcus floricola TaxID=2591691 RepID=A0A5D3AW56_9TREE|nr:hypothetical protein B9479_003677 [Cryptococcus floricola]
MSSSPNPLRPLQHPQYHRTDTQPPPSTPSSASSSQTAPNTAARADQVLYRFYLKTVAVLVDARLTHYGSQTADKKDRWFNLILPEIDLHKTDLQVYRSISTYQPFAPPELPSVSADSCSIPPLLIAFILDTSDVPHGQALLWNRSGGKVALDIGSQSAKGKGKEKEERLGIVLERWTVRAETIAQAPSGSQIAPHTAYRLGIIHFRALHSLVRLLPAYRLYRRLRRSNTGLRMGIKLWGAEGYNNSPQGLKEAWEVMESDLTSLDKGLEELVLGGEEVEPESVEKYDFPRIDLFGNGYTVQAEYRPEADFTTGDLEAVLSEKFVDMDEDWFTPTVAARRRSDSVASSTPENPRTIRKSSLPAPIPSSVPTTSPIPQRQPAATVGSFASGGSYTRSRQVSAAATAPASQKKDKWGALGEGLAFAGRSPAASQVEGQVPPSPNPGGIVAARRLSGHSIQPFGSSSPSASLLRGTPPHPNTSGGAPIPTTSARPSITTARQSTSVGRTSSFLSQSGRSFTHAQVANMYSGSASPPVTGAMSGIHQPPSPTAHQGLWKGDSPISPSSLTFAKQPVPRRVSNSRAGFTPGSMGSPFVPGSIEKDGSLSTSANAPHLIKRYSSSISSRPSSVNQRTALSVSHGSGDSASGSYGAGGGLRRTNTRESGLRHSVEPKREAAIKVADADDIQAFLRTLDSAPAPSSRSQFGLPGGSAYTSMGSSNSRGEIPTSPLARSHRQSPSQPHTNGQVPKTRAWVDEELKRFAGRFDSPGDLPIRPGLSKNTSQSATAMSSARGSFSQGPGTPGLLSASRPSSAAIKIASGRGQGERDAELVFGSRRRSSGGPSPLSQGLVAPGKSPLGSPRRTLGSVEEHGALNRPALDKEEVHGGQGARSLPGSSLGVTTARDRSSDPPLRSAAPYGYPYPTPYPPVSSRPSDLSPQTTGSASTDSYTTASPAAGAGRTQRRGPVILKGGFGGTSASNTPSHSPVRDRSRAGMPSNSGSAGLGIVYGHGKEARAGSVPLDKEDKVDIGRRGSTSIAQVHAYNSGLPSPAISERLTSTLDGLGGLRSASGSGRARIVGQRTAPSSLGPEDHTRRGGAEARRGQSDEQSTEGQEEDEGVEGIVGDMSGLGFNEA